MDVNCRTGVVESCGYEFKQAVAEGVQEAFQEDLEDEQLSLNERMQATIQMTGATQPITQSNSYSMQR
jgi:hypothetical protein